MILALVSALLIGTLQAERCEQYFSFGFHRDGRWITVPASRVLPDLRENFSGLFETTVPFDRGQSVKHLKTYFDGLHGAQLEKEFNKLMRQSPALMDDYLVSGHLEFFLDRWTFMITKIWKKPKNYGGEYFYDAKILYHPRYDN